jgi:hypothetical protein
MLFVAFLIVTSEFSFFEHHLIVWWGLHVLYIITTALPSVLPLPEHTPRSDVKLSL